MIQLNQPASGGSGGTIPNQVAIEVKSASFTLTSTDLNFDNCEVVNASAAVITIPGNIGVAGDMISFLACTTLNVSFAQGAGLPLLESNNGLRNIAGQWLSVTAYWRSPTEVVLQGALA